MVVAGFGNGLTFPITVLIIQRYTTDRLRGRAFTVIISAHNALLGIAMVTAGALDGSVGARWTYAVASLLARLRRDRRSCSRAASATQGVASASRLRSIASWPAGVTGRARRSRQACVPATAAHSRARSRSSRTATRSRTRSSSDVYPQTGHAYAVGLTGPPGVGKSSLRLRLIRIARAADKTVGVISVDPSSPFTQGALLGDRIRLTEHFLDPDVFIRSMGTRGHLGGLAETTLQALLVLDAARKDVVFLETVGTGQSEVGVLAIADTVVLALMPGSGDSIQALKAGIMEIPDVIAINKMRSPDGEDDAERGAPGTGARAAGGLAAADRAHRGGARRGRRRALGEDLGAPCVARVRRASSRRRRREPRPGGVPGRLGTCPPAPRAGGPGRPELAGCWTTCRRAELDPLTAVREILDQVFRIGDDDDTQAR